jgi:hypothetical protein
MKTGLQQPNVPKVDRNNESNGKNLVFPCSELVEFQVFDLNVITELMMNPVKTQMTIRLDPILNGKKILKSGVIVSRIN